MKQSDSPRIKLSDEVAKMRQEIDALRQAVESMEKELLICKEAILHQESRGIPFVEETKKDPFEELCNFCLEIVSPVEIVRQIFVAGVREAATFWAIIDTPPSEDSHRKTYDDQLDTLRILKYNVPFNFEVLDVAELPEKQKTEDAIPPDAKLIWER